MERNEDNGRGVAERRQKKGWGLQYDEKGKVEEIEIKEIKKRVEIKWSMWFKAKEPANRLHPYEKLHEGHTGSPCPGVSVLLLLTIQS